MSGHTWTETSGEVVLAGASAAIGITRSADNLSVVAYEDDGTTRQALTLRNLFLELQSEATRQANSTIPVCAAGWGLQSTGDGWRCVAPPTATPTPTPTPTT